MSWLTPTLNARSRLFSQIQFCSRSEPTPIFCRMSSWKYVCSNINSKCVVESAPFLFLLIHFFKKAQLFKVLVTFLLCDAYLHWFHDKNRQYESMRSNDQQLFYELEWNFYFMLIKAIISKLFKQNLPFSQSYKLCFSID